MRFRLWVVRGAGWLPLPSTARQCPAEDAEWLRDLEGRCDRMAPGLGCSGALVGDRPHGAGCCMTWESLLNLPETVSV